MAQQLFFSRDTEVYIRRTGDTTKLWKVPVLDGFSFSQSTNSSDITLTEMGDITKRGSRKFNDSLAPAEWSFSTYVRPFKATASDTSTYGLTTGYHYAVEELLWALMAGTAASGALETVTENIGTDLANVPAGTYDVAQTSTDGSGIEAAFTIEIDGVGDIVSITRLRDGSGYAVTDTITIAGTSFNPNGTGNLVLDVVEVNDYQGVSRNSSGMSIDFLNSNRSALGTADIFFVNSTNATNKLIYKVDKAVINEASVSFEIDGIATIAWSGMGSVIKEVTDAEWTSITGASTVYQAGLLGTDNFIRNRITTLGVTAANTTIYPGANANGVYNITLTGASLTFSNNVTYLTPEELGVVNVPIGHVTGGRTISGSLTSYLVENPNATDSSIDLYKNMTSDAARDEVSNSFGLVFTMGGTSLPKVEFNIPRAHLEIPTHGIDDVISVETAFTALPSSIGDTDELVITYTGS